MRRRLLVATTVAALAAVVSALPAPASACPACFGRAEGPMVDAARLGIWLLLGVTLGLQGGFAAFFLYLRRRAARVGRREQQIDAEWSHLQREWDGAGRSDGR